MYICPTKPGTYSVSSLEEEVPEELLSGIGSADLSVVKRRMLHASKISKMQMASSAAVNGCVISTEPAADEKVTGTVNVYYALTVPGDEGTDEDGNG